MAKDPAVLFYTSDFLSGVSFFTMEERGQYITLLCEQHQIGHIPENHMISVCGSHDSHVIKKFIKDDNGLYYNQRMEEEKERRSNYCKSRSNNYSGRKKKISYDKSYDKSCENHMLIHMENENENENINKNIDKSLTKSQRTFKNSYWFYLKLVIIAYRELINDSSEIKKQQEFYPNVDIKKSLEKSVRNFWGTKAGWKNKKAKKSKDIDMKRTLINNIDKNKVWVKRENMSKENFAIRNTEYQEKISVPRLQI